MERKEGPEAGDLPLRDKKSEQRGEEAREELDRVPEPGTDPLHEGP